MEKENNCKQSNNDHWTLEELLSSFYTDKILSGNAKLPRTSAAPIDKEDIPDFAFPVPLRSDFDTLMETFLKHYFLDSVPSSKGERGLPESKQPQYRGDPKSPVDNENCINITSDSSSDQLSIEADLKDLAMSVSSDASSEESTNKSKTTKPAEKDKNSISKNNLRNNTRNGKAFSDPVNHEASTSGVLPIPRFISDAKSTLGSQNNERQNSRTSKVNSVPSTINISTSPDIFTTSFSSPEDDAMSSVSQSRGRYSHMQNHSVVNNHYMPNTVPYMPYANDYYMRYSNTPIIPYDNSSIMPYGNDQYMQYANGHYMPNANGLYMQNANGFYRPNADRPYMPNVNGPYIPNANGPYIPNPNEAYMSNINGLYMLDANCTCAPNVNGIHTLNAKGTPIPNANESHGPSANGTCVPNANGTRVPNADGTRVPNANGTRVPNANGTRVPNANGTRFPNANGTRIPNANGAHIPNANGTHTPNANGTRIPNVNETCIPNANGTRFHNANEAQLPNANISFRPSCGNSLFPNTRGPFMPLCSNRCCNNYIKLAVNPSYNNNPLVQFPSLVTHQHHPNLFLTTSAANPSVPTHAINSRIPLAPALQPPPFGHSCTTTFPMSGTPQDNHSGICNICNYSHASSIHTRLNENDNSFSANNQIPGNNSFIRPHLASRFNTEPFRGGDSPWIRPRERCPPAIPRVAGGFHRRLPSLRNLPKSSLNNFRFKGKKVMEKYGRICSNCGTTHSRTWKYDEEGRPFCSTCRYFHVHHRGPPTMKLSNIMQGRNRRGSESEGSKE